MATATGYAPSAGGINCDSDCSVTASGVPPGPAIAACGWGFDLGQVLYVPDYGMVTCGDRFGTRRACKAYGIGLYDVDLWFATRKEAYQWGRKETEIYTLTNTDSLDTLLTDYAETKNRLEYLLPVYQHAMQELIEIRRSLGTLYTVVKALAGHSQGKITLTHADYNAAQLSMSFEKIDMDSDGTTITLTVVTRQ